MGKGELGSYTRQLMTSQLAERVFPLLILIVTYVRVMTEVVSRTYWPYIFTSYAIAGLAYIYYESRHASEEPLPTLRDYLFPKHVWLHRSSMNDCGVFFINYYIFLVLYDRYMLNDANLATLMGTLSGLTERLGKLLHIPQHGVHPGMIPIVLYTIFSYMLSELFFYAYHRSLHRIPLLWHFHKVHHSSEAMTPLTYYRAHPVELWIGNTIRIIGLGLASSIFYYLYPGTPAMVTVGGINVCMFLFFFLSANLLHSHIWLSYGTKLEHIFISPAHHQIHHSNSRRHYDKNFSANLALWDWVFGTLYVTHGKEDISFGLSGRDKDRFQTLRDLYIRPVADAWKSIR